MTAPPAPPQPASESLVVLRRRGWTGPVAVGVLALLGAALVYAADSSAERLVGGSGAAIFGVTAVLLGARNLRPVPALVLDSDGFTDTASGAGAGFVPWSAVTGLVQQRVRGQRYLSVRVADPAAVLARADDGARAAMRANLVLLGTPVNIPLRTLATDVAGLTCAFARNTPAAIPAALTARLPAGVATRAPADATALADLTERAKTEGLTLPPPYLDLLAEQNGWCGPVQIFGSHPTDDLDGVLEATQAGRAEGLPGDHLVLAQDEVNRYTWHTAGATYHIIARSDHHSRARLSTLSDLLVISPEKYGPPLG